MDIGDRVVYVLNDEIDLTRDAGTLIAWDEGFDQQYARVQFDDGEDWTVPRLDLKPLVEKRSEPEPMHLHFGCSENPCPWPGHS